jgi:hypothetical protein
MTLPTLSTNSKYIIVTIAILTSFAVGRYSVQKPIVHTVTDVRTDVKQDQVADTHTQTTITTVKTPDGTVKTVEQINQVADTKTDTQVIADTHVDTTITPPKTNTVNISALVANNFSHGLGITPTYGVSVSKEILGPVTIGAFGLTNGVVGVSIGLSF